MIRERRDLACPYCGAEIQIVEMGPVGYARAAGIECSNPLCGAEFDVTGHCTMPSILPAVVA